MQSTALQSMVGAAYRVRLAETEADVHAAQRLRFEVFNLELNEGLAASWRTYRDADQFDEVCNHLLIEHTASREVVGTYRLQTGLTAAENLGYYGEQEFDFTPFGPLREEVVELGRACVHRDHRKMMVVNLLWRGIAEYARLRGCRYLVGCSSLKSQDPAEGRAIYAKLAATALVEEGFRTNPRPAYVLPEVVPAEVSMEVPRLLRAYLSIGAKICGAPALDREFGTIDFLTLLDLNRLPAAVQNHFLG